MSPCTPWQHRRRTRPPRWQGQVGTFRPTRARGAWRGSPRSGAPRRSCSLRCRRGAPTQYRVPQQQRVSHGGKTASRGVRGAASASGKRRTRHRRVPPRPPRRARRRARGKRRPRTHPSRRQSKSKEFPQYSCHIVCAPRAAYEKALLRGLLKMIGRTVSRRGDVYVDIPVGAMHDQIAGR